MELKNLLSDSDDSRAVSPVIGVILMVAITVILAAVIGTFVLGLGDQVESAPQASITFSGDASSGVTIQHRGGDQLSRDEIELRGAGYTGGGSVLGGSSIFAAGDSVTIPSGEVVSGQEISIVYTGGNREAVIASYDVPE